MMRTPASVSGHVLHVVKTGGFGLVVAGLALLLFAEAAMPCSERLLNNLWLALLMV